MNGKSVLFTIITSILSLVIILASYYGYTRYIKLRFNTNVLGYAKDYLTLDRANINKKIVVSLYASKDASGETMTSTLKSLLDQTVKPDQIIINTPQDSTLKIDDFLTDNNIVSIYKMPKDYGEIGSLICPLLLEKDAGVIIILASERTIYGIEFIERMVETSVKYPDCIIYNRGFNAKQFVHSNERADENKNDIIDADYGVLIKPKFFDSTILDEDRFTSLTILVSVYARKVCIHSTHYKELFQSTVGKSDEDTKKEIILNSVYFPSF